MTGKKPMTLPGLDGTNPLGFFAAMGCAVAVDQSGGDGQLSWSGGPIPAAQLSGGTSPDELVALLMQEIEQWKQSWLIRDSRLNDVKLPPDDLRSLISESREDLRSHRLVAALVTEGVADGKGNAKPSDLYFTAGRQLFLDMARKVLESVTKEDLHQALFGSWTYTSRLPSLMWDTADDRIYALSALDPAGDQKLTEPGAECLALIGITQLPVIAGDERTLTPGCSGGWKNGFFRWPLWQHGLSANSAAALLGSSTLAGSVDRTQLDALGVERLLESDVRRSDQGGYGTFGPPRVLWQKAPAARSGPPAK